MNEQLRRFTRQNRLVSPWQFQNVFDNPYRSKTKNMSVLARTNGVQWARLGLIVSKKCAVQAVRRNRLKRLIRESFRHNKEKISGLDVVIITRRSLTTHTNQEILSELERHWRNLARCKK